jgi:hypothetical protein
MHNAVRNYDGSEQQPYVSARTPKCVEIRVLATPELLTFMSDCSVQQRCSIVGKGRLNESAVGADGMARSVRSLPMSKPFE